MIISKLRTHWIIFLSIYYTLTTCVKAVIKRLLNTSSRAWVDKTIHLWIDNLLSLAGITCNIINPHQIDPQPGQATIIMCNHSSLYDIPISFKAFPKHSIRMLAKKELAKIPFLGKGMQAAEFPFIDRKNRQQSIKDLAYARRLMESGILIWIFPEGTRSKDGKLAPLKKGAFITAIEAKAVIIPVGIRGAYNILPARSRQFNLNQTAEIHIGQVIDASSYSLSRRDDLIKAVHQSIKELVGNA